MKSVRVGNSGKKEEIIMRKRDRTARMMGGQREEYKSDNHTTETAFYPKLDGKFGSTQLL